MVQQLTELKQKWMDDYEVVFGEEVEHIPQTELGALLDDVEETNFVEGEVFKGQIIAIGNDYVTIDIGYKQEGLVSIKEFLSYDGSLKIKEGDEIEVYLERLESTHGNLVLSKDKAEILKAWDRISEACEQGNPLEGTVVAKVKGGLSVDIGVKAFLPGSQIDLRPTRNLDRYIGKKMEFKVIKFNKKRGNIVLSRRIILQEERSKLRTEILGQIQEGMIVKGIVKNITDYGAFIDLGGIDGLLHITDMSWGRVKHPSNVLGIGDEIEVKILKFDAEKERVSLGLKQVQPNPWEEAGNKYEISSKVSGEVVSVKDYGIFVELSDGIEGLVHVSEMSWTGKVKNPTKEYTVGEKVEAEVLEVDIENKRISLGIKQLLPNPWDDLIAKYDIGGKVKGKIKSIVEFGLFIDLDEEVDALVHISDISWIKKSININEEFTVGDEIEAMVLSMDKENQKFCIGIKQLEEDPWKKIEQRYPTGSIVEAEVIRVADFGAFVEIETGIEGLIHISELSQERVEKPSDVIKAGDRPKMMIISVDKEAKKIALSIKAAVSAEESGTMDSYQNEETKSSSSIAEQLKGFNLKDD
ncbi:MAG: 30S ribosomal protein S1 [Bdellovibrionales bacterium]|jgi:small subunit ribosomal protein S1|nr:30S ribosomal protein S1 [Bdellovibrionales bacterium]MBT3526920.1 30S ribosomal protein S1 [Bdellovibrionales bacterium]MBT7669632.1 30S ribosomal protein S1 [Bdellovibrionales bacterium]MBT7767017.1 30S ribosomal protein S1 [Bdellovibrionales bacterium]